MRAKKVAKEREGQILSEELQKQNNSKTNM